MFEQKTPTKGEALFRLEEKMQDPQKARAMISQIYEKITSLKKHLDMGLEGEEFQQCRSLLNAYVSTLQMMKIYGKQGGRNVN